MLERGPKINFPSSVGFSLFHQCGSKGLRILKLSRPSGQSGLHGPGHGSFGYRPGPLHVSTLDTRSDGRGSSKFFTRDRSGEHSVYRNAQCIAEITAQGTRNICSQCGQLC